MVAKRTTFCNLPEEKGGEKLPPYVTYMEVFLNPEGVTPTDLTNTLKQWGWTPVYGRYDYAYKWEDNWGNKDTNFQEYFDHVNKVHEVLRGHNVRYSLRTYEWGKEDFWVKWGE